MDSIDKELINGFIAFLTHEFKTDKHLKHVQFEKWSSQNNIKINIQYYYHENEGHVFVDMRELKENQHHFLHLKDNIISQLSHHVGHEIAAKK